MKTVKVKLVKPLMTGEQVVDAYVFSNFTADFNTRRSYVEVLVVPPTNKRDCGCLIFADWVKGVKAYTYRERVNTPYINIEGVDAREIITKLPEMIKVKT